MTYAVRTTVSNAGATQRVGDVACSLVDDDGSVWVVYRADDERGPEGRVCARRVAASGEPMSAELIVARGARGAVVPGGVAARADGGAAITWRGDEGMAWLAQLEPTGRLRQMSYLEACDGAPAVALADDGVAIVAITRAGSHGVLVQGVVAPGVLRGVFEGPPGSVAPALAIEPGQGPAIAYCVPATRALEVRDARGATVRVAMPSARIVPHAPVLAVAPAGARACAWIGEDTGRLALYAGVVGEAPVRRADVWAPLERIDGSAPSLCAVGDAHWVLAWREERGPRPAVYARRLDAACRDTGPEVRVSARGTTAPAGRVGLAATRDGGWICAHVERDEHGAERVVLLREN